MPHLTTHRTQKIHSQRPDARNHRTTPEVLCPCLTGSEPSFIYGETSMDGTWSNMFQRLLDQIWIWGTWRPGPCPELFVPIVWPSGSAFAMKGCTTVILHVWMGGACQSGLGMNSRTHVFQQNTESRWWNLFTSPVSGSNDAANVKLVLQFSHGEHAWVNISQKCFFWQITSYNYEKIAQCDDSKWLIKTETSQIGRWLPF